MAKGKELGRAEGEELGIAKGKELGRAEGEYKIKKETAQKMLSMGISKEAIQQMTGWTEEVFTEADARDASL